MDTRKLEALLTAVELGSFTRAAEVLGYTQSGLTHMMNSLEKDCCCRAGRWAATFPKTSWPPCWG